MPESRLFMSSISRRQLARRRRSALGPWLTRLLFLVMLAAIVVVAFLAGRGSF